MTKKILFRFCVTFIFPFFIIPQISYSAQSGSVAGYIVDSKTKEPLIGANVLVEGTQIGASSDENGYYIITGIPSGTQVLKFLYIGYNDLIKSEIMVMPASVTQVNAQMKASNFESDEIVVEAGYFVEDELPQPSTLNLTREEIRRFPGGFEDVVRTVSTLPGVAINSGGGRNDLLVRGGGPSENLYIVNNIEIPNINHFGTQGSSSGSLSFINLDFINNVTFSTGGFTARYGDKMSSVLNLELNEGRSDRLGGKLLISATQFGTNLEGPLTDNGNFIFSARKSYLDLIFKAAGLPFVPVYTDFNFIANYRLSNRDKLSFLGLLALDQVDRDLSNAKNKRSNSALMDNTQTQLISGINYRHLLKSGFLDLTFSAVDNHYKFSQQDTFDVKYFKNDSREQEYSAKLTLYHAFNKNFGVYSGLNYKSLSTTNNIFFADSIYDRSGNRVSSSGLGLNSFNKDAISGYKLAGFVEGEWQPFRQWLINGGVRMNVYSPLNQSVYWSPRLSVSYNPFPKWRFKASGGIYHQSPSYIWLVNPVNRELSALQNRMIVLGSSYSPQPDWRTAIEVFYKNYTNLPAGTIPGVSDYIVLTNTGANFGGREDDFQSFGLFNLNSDGTGIAYGAELSFQKRFSDTPYYGQASLTYTKSILTANNGKDYPGQYDQRFIFSFIAGYILNQNWEFSSKFRFFTGAPYTPVYDPDKNPVNPGEIQNLPSEYLTERLDNSYVLDVRVDRYFLFDTYSFILFLDIQNVLNLKVPQKPRYDFGDQEVVTSGDIGILPSIGFSFNF